MPPVADAKFKRPTKEGTKLFTFIFSGHNPNTKVKLEVTGQIAFEQFGPEDFVFVFPGLTQLRDATVKTLKLFEGEF